MSIAGTLGSWFAKFLSNVITDRVREWQLQRQGAQDQKAREDKETKDALEKALAAQRDAASRPSHGVRDEDFRD